MHQENVICICETETFVELNLVTMKQRE